jgi:hypothetical protein
VRQRLISQCRYRYTPLHATGLGALATIGC